MQVPEYPNRAFSIFFPKFAEIFTAEGPPQVSLTPAVANLKKYSIKKVLNIKYANFQIIIKDPIDIFRGLGKIGLEKNMLHKIS